MLKHVKNTAKQSFLRIVQAEFQKLFSLRSTLWLTITIVGLAVSFAALAALVIMSLKQELATDPDLQQTMDQDPSTQGFFLGENMHVMTVNSAFGLSFLLLMAIALLYITHEFGSGAIRSTVLAVPRRGQIVAAKMIVIGCYALAVVALFTLLSHYLAWPILAQDGLATHYWEPQTFWVYLVDMCYGVAISWFALGLGFLVRNSAGTIVIVVAVVFVLPAIWGLLPGEVMETLGHCLLGALLERGIDAAGDADFPNRYAALGLMFAWAGAALGAGWWSFQRRDIG